MCKSRTYTWTFVNEYGDEYQAPVSKSQYFFRNFMYKNKNPAFIQEISDPKLKSEAMAEYSKKITNTTTIY
jgi:hypothetical protein